MNAKELAAKLNGIEYPARIPPELIKAAKADGLVIVYGVSDDLMEFEGAISDEVGCYGGGDAFLDAEGLLPSFDDLCDNKDVRGLRDYFARFDGFQEIEPIWNAEGYSWIYKTDIPHVCFDVMEDGEKYCRGIVFSLADLKRTEP
jgi:hypothetical protein